MKTNIRKQITLFVPAADAGEIEYIRKTYNAQQYGLIKSHVTLCREDEIQNLPLVLRNLQQPDLSGLVIRFGPPVRFDNGLGLMLPAQGDNTPFYELRAKILSGSAVPLRLYQPHITLMHPRNSVCTDAIFQAIQQVDLPTALVFDAICLIEQLDGGPWNILERYPLISR